MWFPLLGLRPLFLTDPGEGGGAAGGAATATPPATAGAAGASSEPAGDGAPPSTPPPAATAAGAAGGGGTPPPFDLLGYAREQGLDLSGRFQDPREAAQYLIQQVRHANAYTELGQRMAPHYSEFQAYLQALQQQQQAAPAPRANPFGLPDYDPAWLDMVEKDPATGELVPKRGAPPDVAGKLMMYGRALRQAQDKFWQNPAEALGPVIQQVIQPLLEQHVQANLTQYADNQFAQQFIAQNTAWLHMRDPQGNLIMDPLSQKPALAPAGQRFLYHLRAAEAYGIQGLTRQQEYAMNMLRGEVAQSQFQQQQQTPQQQQQAANQQFLDQFNRRQPNHSGSMAPATNPVNGTGAQNSQLSLRERLQFAMQQNGITDADFRNDER